MTDLNLATRILGILYDKYFENYIVGIMVRNIANHVEGVENEISKAVKLLENEYLIVRDSLWYKITSSGIERYEQTLSPSAVNKRLTQRKLILETLKEIYDKNTEQDMEEKELSSKIRSEDRMELMSQIKFLDDIGLVHWQPFSSFLVRLTAEGALHFEKYEKHDYQSMSNAYRILFILENHLRDFLEKKLTDKFGTEWWEKGISKGLRDKVDDKKRDEAEFPWKVSETKSDMEYLQFPDLYRIIQNQRDVFKSVFSDVPQIELRLKELEEIRNAIAHTRTLSQDSMTRLEQYNEDIFQLTK